MTTGNHIVDEQDRLDRKDKCCHKTETKYWCKAYKVECQECECCIVLDDDIADCEDMEVKEVCEKCGASFEVI